MAYDREKSHGPIPQGLAVDWDELAPLIVPFLTDDRGEVTPAARIAAELRTQQGRHELLAPLIWAMVPRHVDPVAWRHWFRGGRLPVGKDDVEKVTAPGKARSQKLLKAGAKVRTAARRAERLKEELDAAEAALVQAQNLETALLQQAITTHFVETLAPIFAMGPAWTIIRAVNAEPEPDDMRKELEGIRPDKVDRITQMIREERVRDHRIICDGMVKYGNDEDFRYLIRKALLNVVQQREKQDNEA